MTTTKQSAHHQVLDPCLLGRPVHLLHIFAAQLRDDLTQAMRLSVNRRYWGAFRVEDVQFTRFDGEQRGRWLSFAAPAGHIAFSLERKVLLSVLNFRYGSPGKSDNSPPPVDEDAVRVTATEERLAVVLGQQLAGTLAGRIELNLPAVDKPAAAEGADDGVDTEFKPAPGAPPPKGNWTITVTVADHASGASGQFWFALDKALMASVPASCCPKTTARRSSVAVTRTVFSSTAALLLSDFPLLP